MEPRDNNEERLTQAYERLLQRVDQTLSSVNERSGDILHRALDSAKEKAVELGELTREEADKIHESVIRDLHAAGEHLAEGEREFADRIRLNLLLAEKTLQQRLAMLAQETILGLDHLHKARQRFDEWHTGEVTMIGMLYCKKCGEQIQFKRIGRIPPCPRCHATVFERAKK